ncbi:hypothetical protein EZV62_017113 [Acer yangbiense]|uniref:SURP motif domain-containing protein n=1 Tax=Acer yangbiense TaxID=1000413 RepID=A0A5C7HFI1_9ROSI|nr:hypothetical protein EZV62_017113 [Acer yangbiense]
MDKGTPTSLFVNDGSFMERFKQLQQNKDKEKESDKGSISVEESKPIKIVSGTSTPKLSMRKPTVDAQKTNLATSGGKLAFSLKSKSKLVAPPVKLGADEDEDETDAENGSVNAPVKRQKLGQPGASEQSSNQVSIVYTLSTNQHWWKEMFNERFGISPPPSPSDPTVKKVAEKLASFVAKNGRQFEYITREKNPGDTPFKFLFDESCADYKYYEYLLAEEEKALSQSREVQTPHSGGMGTSSSKSTSAPQRSMPQQNYQTPASALYETTEELGSSSASGPTASAGRAGNVESSGPNSADPIAMMEFYVKKAAQEERRRQPKHSKDEMPPPPSLLGGSSSKRGHHMGDYIPLEELEKFMSTCNDVSAQKAAQEAADRARIQADNIGHRLLSKMGWKEGAFPFAFLPHIKFDPSEHDLPHLDDIVVNCGPAKKSQGIKLVLSRSCCAWKNQNISRSTDCEGLGSSKSGIADPIKAGDVKKDHLGVGAHKPGEVTPEDDIYEQYKKRMMLGYKHRPNPLNNPRKAYY